MPTSPTLHPSLFLDRVVRFLIPYYLPITADLAVARADILETLACYGARTRAEVLNAVQVIAFGFSALDTLAEAKAMEQEMSPVLRLRYRGCANSLHRSGQQAEKTLERRLACDRPNTPRLAAEPVNDIPDAEAAELLQQTCVRIDTTRNRLSGAHPAALPQTNPASPQDHTRWFSNSAIMQALSGQGMPNAAASAG
jgi:hypothetical protein